MKALKRTLNAMKYHHLAFCKDYRFQRGCASGQQATSCSIAVLNNDGRFTHMDCFRSSPIER